MVVICPKCKVKLKVGDEKLSPQGTPFKCPKCSTVLLVKKAVSQARPLDPLKVLVAHEDVTVRERAKAILEARDFRVITAADGIEAMVHATRELPFLAVLSVSLPKIYGFEVGSRLKKRPETRDMKSILVASLYDKDRYRREPLSLHGADGYIEEHELEDSLIEQIDSLRGITPEKVEERVGRERMRGGTEERVPASKVPEKGPTEEKVVTTAVGESDRKKPNEMVEKARRLARTIVADIYLYNRSKVDEAIKNGTFHTAFASDLKEGLKLYEARISAEIRRTGDFFNEAIDNFIEKKRRELS